ncbi:MAG: T9SS type A sorting domain-containing protein [Bacteroidia bacterium]
MKKFEKKASLLFFLFMLLSSLISAQDLYTIAGTCTQGYSGDGGPATAATFWSPAGVAVDNSGNIYIADNYYNVIRKVTISGIISTIAGNGYFNNEGGYSGDGGPATAAELSRPTGLAIDAKGNIYIADTYNDRIRKVSIAGIITTVAGGGNGGQGYGGDGGPATSAILYYPSDVKIDASGNIFIADAGNDVIRKVNKSGIISTVAGIGGYGQESSSPCPATSSALSYPTGIAIDAKGNLYIADEGNNLVSMVNSSGILNVVAGGGSGGTGVLATTAQLYSPGYVAVDSSDNIYIEEASNTYSDIRIVNTLGIINAFAGGYSYGGETCHTGDYGPAISAQFNNPQGIAIDNFSNIYFAIPSFYQVDEISNCSPLLRPTITVSGSTSICPGTDLVLKSNYSTNNLWSNGDTSQSITVNSKGIYYLEIFPDSSCTFKSLNDTITVKTASLKSGNDTGISCGETLKMNAVCNPPSPDSISWVPSTYLSNTTIVNPVCTVPANNITYTVTANLSNGCITKDSITISRKPLKTNIALCFVTVDTASTNNIIVWDTSDMKHTDSIQVYYLNSSLIWAKLLSVPFSAPSYIIDTVNDPNVTTVRYKLVSVDSCGDTASSIWHNTMWIQSSGGTFSWGSTAYQVEGNSTPVKTYTLYRDNISNGNWDSISSVNGLQSIIADPNYSNYPKGRWRVEATLNIPGCPSPDLRPDVINNTTTRSNTQHNSIFTSASTLATALPSISVFPNPANGIFQLKITNYESGMNNTLEVYNVLGEKVASSNSKGGEFYSLPSGGEGWAIDLSNQPAGVYFVNVISDKYAQVVKLIKE